MRVWWGSMESNFTIPNILSHTFPISSSMGVLQFQCLFWYWNFVGQYKQRKVTHSCILCCLHDFCTHRGSALHEAKINVCVCVTFKLKCLFIIHYWNHTKPCFSRILGVLIRITIEQGLSTLS